MEIIIHDGEMSEWVCVCMCAHLATIDIVDNSEEIHHMNSQAISKRLPWCSRREARHMDACVQGYIMNVVFERVAGGWWSLSEHVDSDIQKG